ncbi:serine hydrolase domain-containing protein [Microcella sp.]|uniref:serine hydrolase domain-containing protein n=1 Tax=Microcella sp. TaxID=1913979 RepID=UPI0025655A70|nr:serine hydrolase domain-containing protein [Microcella sp.]MBX9472848.1 beta-lactamase family protein [Microcella sp.]
MTAPRPLVLTVTALAAIVALAGCAVEREPVPQLAKVPLSTDTGVQRTAKLVTLSDELMATFLEPDRPGCSAAVGVTGEVVWAAAGGLADLTTGDPLTTETRFDMASISKQFTATSVLVLEREGSLSLDDPLSAHVDGLPQWADEVTLEQLMHHTARVPDFWIELEAEGVGFTDAAEHATVLAAIARTDELLPGEGYAYANSHYVLLAEVVEAVSGQSFPQFLAERLTSPLALDLSVDPGLTAPDVATPYDTDDTLLRGGWAAYGHSGIVTTPTELVRWGDQYRLGELVQADVVAGAAIVLDDEQPNGELYAAGIRIEPDGSLYHSGRWGGYISDLTITPDRETVIAVACNGRGAPRFEIADALRELWAPARPSEDD